MMNRPDTPPGHFSVLQHARMFAVAITLTGGGLWLAACDNDPPTALGAPTNAPASPAPPPGTIDPENCDDPDAPDAAAGAELPLERAAITSNDGTYRLIVEPESGVIPRNRYFALILTLEGTQQPIDPAGVTLVVSGSMPHHEHGLNTMPIVERRDDRTALQGTSPLQYRVHGMLLHMPGRWELYFDITESGITERAQFTLELP